MQDTEFCEALLGLKDPRRVTKVELDPAASRADIWIEDPSGVKWNCSECRKKATVYDHSEERVWRHLNTCQSETYSHARLPRVKCPEHGVRQVCAPWAEPGSRFTLLYGNREHYRKAILFHCGGLSYDGVSHVVG